MREVQYIPAICQDKSVETTAGVELTPAKYKGHVVLKVPSIEQRLEYLEEIGFEFGAEEGLKAGVSNMTVVRKMVGIAKQHISAVSIVEVETQEKYDCADDLCYDPAFQETLIEISTKILHGMKISKNSKPS